MLGLEILLAAIFFPIIAGIYVLLFKDDKSRNYYILFVLVLEFLLVLLIMTSGEMSISVWQITDRLSISFRSDPLSKFFACIMSAIWLLAAIFSFKYMTHEKNVRSFFLFYVVTIGVLMGVCFADNLMTLYLCYEMMSILTVPLVIHSRTKEAVAAGFKYLGYSIFGAGLGLFGFFFLNTYCITTDFVGGGNLNMAMVSGNEELLLWVYLIMMIGFGCKAGMFPLHSWLPTAHPVAPSPASAVLSGIITKCGVIAIIRTTYYLFGVEFLSGTWVQSVLLILTIITVFMGSMLAYKEQLLKKRFAYSTISQVSYVLFGIMLMNEIAFLGALLQVFFHAIAKNILFLCAGAVIFKTGKTYVHEFKGIGKEMPVVMLCFLVATLSLIGIPPMGGFISKWFLAVGAILPQYGILGIVGVSVLLISALLTAGYLIPIVSNSFVTGPDFKFEKKEPNIIMTLPLVILSILIVIFGMFPNMLVKYIENIATVIF